MRFLIVLRSVIFTTLFPLTILLFGLPVIFFGFFKSTKKISAELVSFWGRLCCRAVGVRVRVIGRDNIPARGCLLLFNHSSFFDVFAIAGYIKQARFGAKAELFKIPVFAQAMSAMGTLPIARNNREEVFKIYEEAKKRFAQGEIFALSPEGGRFYGQELSPFKAGPFIFAMSAGAPVVPVVLHGAYEALPKGGFLFNKKFWSHEITINILEPVETGLYTEAQRKDLQQLVYERMNRVWRAGHV